jgi:uncharacterized protein
MRKIGLDEKNWQASQFNEYLGELKKDTWIIYNNLTGAMIEANRDIYDPLINNKVEGIGNPNIIESLSYGKFIKESGGNEVDEFVKLKRNVMTEVKVIGLQILPTLGCNFKCTYCYQTPVEKIKLMSKETMDSIIAYVTKKIIPTTNSLNTAWFGGEPLLATKQIDYLSNSFLQLVETHNLRYNSLIVTNGYLLNKKNVDLLERNKIKSCQVTIDGPSRIHDKRRMLKTGAKTWKRIVDNLKYAVEKNIKIVVRVNLDKTNIDTLEELHEEFQNYGISNRISYSIGIVTTFGKACKSLENVLLTLDEADEILRNKDIVNILDRSRNTKMRPVPGIFGCVATSKNSAIIGPVGEIYKCSNNVGDVQEICGNIRSDFHTTEMFKKWERFDNSKIEDCYKCSMIPICGGHGCAFDYIIEKKDIYKCDTNDFHQNYLENLRNIYRQKKNSPDKN